MSRHYSIWIVTPPAYPHSRCFEEVAVCLQAAFQALGHEVPIVNEPGDIRDWAIVLGANLLPRVHGPLPPRLILFNLEQILPGSSWLEPPYIELLRHYPVWDYSRRNIVRLKEDYGIYPVTLCGIGYMPVLTRIEAVAEDIDVLFIGSMNDRRKAVLDKIARRGKEVTAAFGSYGKPRDQLIARSKLLLNTHFYESQVLEIVRVSYLLANRKCVVSETGHDGELEAPVKEGIAFAPYAGLADSCLRLLDDAEERHRLSAKGFECFSALSQVPMLERALAELDGLMKPRFRNVAEPEPAADNADSAAVQAKFMKGFALHQRGQLARAQAFYQQVLKVQPGHFDALHLSGVIAFQTKNPARAVELIGRAIAINPDNAAAYNNRGTALQELGRLDEALDSFEHALKITPDYVEALNNRGNMLMELRRLDEALDSFDRALKVEPNYAQAHNNRGNVLVELKRPEEALDSYDRALRINPEYAGALNNRGDALQDLKRLNEALDSYDRALTIEPDYAEALSSRGDTLQKLKRPDEALDSYELALKIKPDIDYLYGTWLHTRITLGDWSDAESKLAQLFRRVQRNEKVIPPFTLLALTGSLPLQRRAAETWVNDGHPASLALPVIPKYARHARIRVGYYSADYHDHATMYLMAELFERHDRERFEVVAFSFGPDVGDEMRKRASAAFDTFIDVRNKPDKDIALLSRNLEIDIAVDLKGFTQDMRLGIFMFRAAPIQVNYLGYPGTTGAEYIDYLIADGTLIPQPSQQHYSEKIVYLPDSYQVNDRKRPIANTTFSREELELPGTGFVFCCFNDNYKITPQTFIGWMRILKQVPGSVLWLLEGNRAAAEHFRKVAEQGGVDAARLVFAKRLPLAEHLARHRIADLFLDTLPCNAHTTASDALWAGLPVLTCMGEAFAGRVAASLLNAIGLPELIATTQEQYEALAVELATRPERLGQIKQKLEKNRLSAPLFDTELFTKHIEDAYVKMYERYQADLPPEHIYVSQ